MGADPAEAPAASRRQISLWALASLVCGLGFLCPLASMMGPLLGVVALAEIGRKPHRTGRRLAVAGIVAGLAALAGWGMVARLWHVNARIPLIYGPAAELAAGLAGDVAAFKSAFHGDGAAAAEAEAIAFLSEVRGRYGRLVGSGQREEAGGTEAGTRQLRIPYTFQFESGPVDAEAQFVLWADDAPGLVLKFRWLVIRDDELGDLVYPASATAEADRGAETNQGSPRGE